MYDIAIIGSGPCGMSAAITARARNKEVIIFGNPIESNYLYKAEKVNNYLGFYDVTGKELLESFLKHTSNMGVVISNKKVLEVFSMGDKVTLNVNNEFISAKTVIIATGVPKISAIRGEDKFLGRGVSYCATCDGFLYKDKDVIVYIENKNDEEEVKFLSEICRKVYVVTKNKDINISGDNIEQISEKSISEILGDDIVSAAHVGDKTIDVSGVFILRDSIMLDSLVKGLELSGNHIKVKSDMSTNIKRVFAAGDCVGRPYQISKAAGEGQIAAFSAIKLIDDEGKIKEEIIKEEVPKEKEVVKPVKTKVVRNIKKGKKKVNKKSK